MLYKLYRLGIISFYEPQAWKTSRGVVCCVRSERVNLSSSLIAQTDVQLLREKL